ncbi:MAG: bifunctional riboflavin kinase/FAD synthetase [Lachnospiraceae bacterium]|nr:bifunctional riboflavin kinase/FAD synthetase [Lachnospiraceae bacterium]
MQIIEGTTEFELMQKSAVAIGKFDGIHLGHRKLLDRILEQKKKGLLAVVFTFDPAPAALFSGNQIKELMSREEKRAAFAQMGIDVLVEFPLNIETAATEPERFVREYLTQKLKAAVIAAGTDLSFGKKGAGNAALLYQLSEECGYQVEIIDKVSLNGEEISSTLIREAVANGEMEKVTALLGTPYQVKGIVTHGKKLGRTLGMPTVNLLPKKEKLLPPNGVYYSRVWILEQCYPAISNIGYKPTVSEEKVMGVETYLYDFDEDVYGKEVMVELLAFKRPEMKFSGIEDLKRQTHMDIEQGRNFHKKTGLS